MTRTKERAENEQEQQPYEAPEVRTDEVFETLALTCAKVDTRQCPVVPGEPALQS